MDIVDHINLHKLSFIIPPEIITIKHNIKKKEVIIKLIPLDLKKIHNLEI